MIYEQKSISHHFGIWKCKIKVPTELVWGAPVPVWGEGAPVPVWSEGSPVPVWGEGLSHSLQMDDVTC